MALLLLVSSYAHAQDAPTAPDPGQPALPAPTAPPEAAPPPPQPAAPAVGPAPSRFAVSAGFFAAIPGDDIADAVETSPGIGGKFHYNFSRNLSAHASARFIVIRVKDLPDDVSVTYVDFGVGGRYTHPLSPTIDVYGELEAQVSVVRVKSPPFYEDTDSDPGVAVRVGGLYALTPKISIGGFAGVTKNFAGGADDDTDSRWVDIGAGGKFSF